MRKNKPAAKNKSSQKTTSVSANANGTDIKRKYPFWFYSIPILIIVLFFLLLEGGLRLFGYGENTPKTFVQLTGSYPNHLFFNPEITKKYFTNLKKTPAVIPDPFLKEKSPNTFRVFVLGESSAAGWPYEPNVSFPRFMKRKLEEFYPQKNIEVVNLGVSAICTYTLRDIIHDVLEQKPDLVCIYTGHNEYYGALGAASTQSLGKSRAMINFVMSIQNIRVVQLIQNIIKSVLATVSPEEFTSNETLMSKVIGESSIPYNSDLYKAGISQFEGNMRDILSACQKANVKVMVGNVASNLKDQKPFVSTDTLGLEKAENIFAQANAEYGKGNFSKAKELYIKSRDLDALRFRAPSEINSLIKNLSGEFGTVMVDVESGLNSFSPNGITGKELMVDHLHPNIKGYELIANLFLDAALKNSLLPDAANFKIETGKLTSIESVFSPLDSIVADLKLRTLLGAHPFVPKGSPNLLRLSFKPTAHIDTLAMMTADRMITLEEAHYEMADIYWKNKNVQAFENEMNVLINERPINQVHHMKLITTLLSDTLIDKAIVYLYRMEKYCPSEFSTKRLGALLLSKNRFAEALPYLEKDITLNSNDARAWYNLAGAYYGTKNISKAITAVNRSLEISPRNALAQTFKKQLEVLIGQK